MTGQKCIVNCPTCRKEVDYRQRARNPYFPFCSERCKLIDMGKWLEGKHKIEEPLTETASQPPEEAGQEEKES